MKKLDSDLKSFSDLTQAQGQIHITPGNKQKIRAFIQWTRDEIRMGMNPASAPFPMAESINLIRRYKTQALYVKTSGDLSDAAKPIKFKEDTEWDDWKPTFISYLWAIQGRDGISLAYVVQNNPEPSHVPSGDMFQDYNNNASMRGEAFAIDNRQVYTFTAKFIVGNTQAETKVQAINNTADGRAAFYALFHLYKGIGIYSNGISKADKILNILYYNGEKRPHMWWDEFEQQLLFAYATYDCREGRQVHSNETKIRTLMKKIGASFLESTHQDVQSRISGRGKGSPYGQHHRGEHSGSGR